MSVIGEGLGKTHRGIIWSMLGDSDNPYTIYDFSETEHSMYPEKILKGFKGFLLSDGTNKFNGIITAGATSANCWAHLHCRFEEAWLDDKTTVEFPMGVIKILFDIERVAKNLTEVQRKSMRLRLAKPKLALLKNWLDQNALKEPPKSKLADAISYTLIAGTHFVSTQILAASTSLTMLANAPSSPLFLAATTGSLLAPSTEGILLQSS